MTAPRHLVHRLLLKRQAVCWLLFTALLTPAAGADTRGAEPRWEQLSAAERQVLRPLEREWPSIDATRKLKWRELAGQYPRLDAERQALLRSRMAAWASMNPDERAVARLRYQEAKQLPEAERRARWKAYQALSDERRRALADKAQTRLPSNPNSEAARSTAARNQAAAARLADAQPKTNIVPPATATQAPRTVSPGTVRAAVGASTRPISERPAPPPHQQPGLPKIAATPGFVDRSTLLPQRGPQGAAAITPPERTAP